MIRPRASSSSVEVVIERRGYITQRVLVDGVELHGVRRVECIDDAQDAPTVRLELFALARYVEVEPEDARPQVVAGQLPLQERQEDAA